MTYEAKDDDDDSGDGGGDVTTSRTDLIARKGGATKTSPTSEVLTAPSIFRDKI